MAKKKKTKGTQHTAGGKSRAAVSVSASAGGLAQAKEAVEACLASGKQKAALDLAKDTAKKFPGPEAEALLLVAYCARIEGMLAKDMAREALALLQVAEGRFHNQSDRFAPLRSRCSARGGDLGSLVAPLADLNLPPERRAEIEAVIAAEVSDLEALASCSALPEDHALRRAAAEVSAAFKKATAGPVTDEEIALPGVSRRSPLAPWKLLIRAIALFHRGDDAACIECAGRLPAGSAPARLVPVFKALCGGSKNDDLWQEAQILISFLFGDCKALRAALKRFEEDFDIEPPKKVIAIVRTAIEQCRRTRPDLLEDLKQRISLRFLAHGIDPLIQKELFGFAPLKNARYWRMAALLAESGGDVRFARSAWEEFRLHAIREGWFVSESVIEAALLLHMASLSDPDDEFEEDDYDDDYDDGGVRLPCDEKAMNKHYADQDDTFATQRAEWKKSSSNVQQDNGALFARACALDPRPENFRKWRDWARFNAPAEAEEKALLRWAEALPRDPEPFVQLAEDAERRSALNKALGYLEQAEARDALDPRLRRLRFRIAMATALRHLKGGKAHLLRKDLEAIEGTREGNAPALAALIWAAASMEGAQDDIASSAQKVRELLKGDMGAAVLLGGVASAAGKAASKWTPPQFDAKEAATLEGIGAIARGLRAAVDGHFPALLPKPVEAALSAALCMKMPRADAGDLLMLAQTALAFKRMQLAYDASGAGLRLRGPNDARLLLVRAQTFPSYDPYRRYNCLGAAHRLVRDTADRALADEIMEVFQRRGKDRVPRGFDAHHRRDALAMDESRARDIVDFERSLIAGKTRENPPRTMRNSMNSAGKFIVDRVPLEDDEDDVDMDMAIDDFMDNLFGRKGRMGGPGTARPAAVEAVLKDMLDFIEARKGKRIPPSGSACKNFEDYCAAVPHLNEQWQTLKARYKDVTGERFKFSALQSALDMEKNP